jgi:hypothetical protein
MLSDTTPTIEILLILASEQETLALKYKNILIKQELSKYIFILSVVSTGTVFYWVENCKFPFKNRTICYTTCPKRRKIHYGGVFSTPLEHTLRRAGLNFMVSLSNHWAGSLGGFKEEKNIF